MRKKVFLMILLFPIALLGLKIGLFGDYQFYTMNSTPVEDVSMMGLKIDALMDSPGNVRMGFGIGYEFVTADASFIGEEFTGAFEIYSVGEYRSELTSVLDFFIVTRGGLSVPNFDFSKMGYFTDISVLIGYPFTEKWYVSFGFSIKSHSYLDSYVSFVSLEMGIGGDL